jgi:hypothetical protein
VLELFAEDFLQLALSEVVPHLSVCGFHYRVICFSVHAPFTEIFYDSYFVFNEPLDLGKWGGNFWAKALQALEDGRVVFPRVAMFSDALCGLFVRKSQFRPAFHEGNNILDVLRPSALLSSVEDFTVWPVDVNMVPVIQPFSKSGFINQSSRVPLSLVVIGHIRTALSDVM